MQVRKTFMMLSFCNACRRLVLHGLKCQTCAARYHQHCATERQNERCPQGSDDAGYVSEDPREYFKQFVCQSCFY